MSDIIENNNEELEDDENYITLTDDDGKDNRLCRVFGAHFPCGYPL